MHINNYKLYNLHNVLIDTWWNVNMLYVMYLLMFVHVLIDTWWNVNEA